MSTPFADRHIGTDSVAQLQMLSVLGYDTVEDLVHAAVPESIRAERIAETSIPAPATEREALAELRAIARHNKLRRSMIGLGYYGTLTPSVIQRNVLENPSWYTAYTPYQPEISQGRLEALINFQTMVADLTGMATANASMLDEATAVVEGMLLARRASKSPSAVFLVDADALPQTKAVLATRAEAVGIELVEVDFAATAGRAATERSDAAYRDESTGRADFETRPAGAPQSTALLQGGREPGHVVEHRHPERPAEPLVEGQLAACLAVAVLDFPQ